MHYIDTSVLAAILLDDAERERAEKRLESLRAERQCLSGWTGVEMFSAIARRVRTRELTAKKAVQARQLYLDEFVAKLEVLNAGVPEFERARALLTIDNTGLRSGDALHLAIALNHRVTAFHTFDETLRKAANRSGLHAPSF